MSDEQSMSVKAYLDTGNGTQEVRRFGVPENTATNFSYLREKICSVFNLGRQNIIITWKDSEGDAIIISSDEELVEAIADSVSKQKMQVFRVNVAIKSADARSSESVPGNQQGDVHDGIVCDVCEGPIVGIRYNCVTCQDFDLCGACETKGLHREHKMIRMPKPRSNGEPRFWWKEHGEPAGGFSTHFGMHGGVGGGGMHGKMGGDDGNSFSYSSSSTGPGPQSGSWCGWGPWMGRGGRSCNRNGGRGRGGWKGWWGKNCGAPNGDAGCWHGQGQTVGGSSCQQQQQQQHQKPQQEKNQEQQQQQQQQQQANSNNSDKDRECPWTSTNGGPCPFTDGPPIPNPERVAEEVQFAAQEAQKMAQHVAHHFATQMATDQVANVMRGIWTAWSGQQPPGAGSGAASSTHSASSSTSRSASYTNVNESSQPNASNDQQAKDADPGSNQSSQEQYLRNVGENVATMLEPLGIDVDVSVEHNGIRQRCSLSEEDLQSLKSPTSKTPNSSTPPPQEAATSTASTNTNMEVQTDPPAQSTATEMEVCNQPEADNPMESDGEDWTLVNRDSQSPEKQPDGGAKPKSPPTERRVQYPNLQEFQPHSNPAIQRALEQMMSMGYNNEGGWLTNLLEMKQGDINQVLDLLQPVNK